MGKHNTDYIGLLFGVVSVTLFGTNLKKKSFIKIEKVVVKISIKKEEW